MSRSKEHQPELHTCVICGIETRTERHHCVPKNALKPIGIKGTNNEANLVNVCGPKDKDCHLKLDQMAIRKRLFWRDGEFVPISEMPKETYVEIGRYCDMPKRRKRRR